MIKTVYRPIVITNFKPRSNDNELHCPNCRKLLAKKEGNTYIYQNSSVAIPVSTYIICKGVTYNGKLGKETTCNTTVLVTNQEA